MNPNPSEQIVGAYLTLIEGCDFVDFNARPRGGGLAGLGELDVIGLDFDTSTAWLVEVITHLHGLRFKGGYAKGEQRVRDKFERQKNYAKDYLDDFSTRHYQLWSPVVPRGKLMARLEGIDGLELICNGEYARRIDALREDASAEERQAGNDAYRVLQIIEHLRRD